MIVALEVPLALNLQRRGIAELKAQSLGQAQAIASVVGPRQQQSTELSRIATDAAKQVAGRVIVVNATGNLIADSAGPGLLDHPYATNERPELMTALRDNIPASRIAKSETLGEEILATAAPVLVGGNAVGAVRITQPMAALRAGVRRTLAGVVAIGIGGLAAGLIIAIVLAGSLSRPLRRLAGAASQLGAGDLSVRAGRERGSREIEEMARSFDEMADRLESLVRAQREFAGNASHQLRTPLTGMKLRLEAAASKAPPDVRKDLEAAERETDRLATIVERLLMLAKRTESGAPAGADLGAAVERASARWAERVESAGGTLERRGGVALAGADGGDLDQILDNLIDNAIRYAPGALTVETSRDERWAILAVEDRGPGIAPDERARVTERFYRGRGATPGGSGLGLAIVRELVERWGGEVEVGAGGGTRIEVRLPVAGSSGVEPAV